MKVLYAIAAIAMIAFAGAYLYDRQLQRNANADMEAGAYWDAQLGLCAEEASPMVAGQPEEWIRQQNILAVDFCRRTLDERRSSGRRIDTSIEEFVRTELEKQKQALTQLATERLADRGGQAREAILVAGHPCDAITAVELADPGWRPDSFFIECADSGTFAITFSEDGVSVLKR